MGFGDEPHTTSRMGYRGRARTASEKYLGPRVSGTEFKTQADFIVVSRCMHRDRDDLRPEPRSLERSRRAGVAMREDEFAAEAVGWPTIAAQLLAYVMGNVAGLAGRLLRDPHSGRSDPTSFTFQLSVPGPDRCRPRRHTAALQGVLRGRTGGGALPELLSEFASTES